MIIRYPLTNYPHLQIIEVCANRTQEHERRNKRKKEGTKEKGGREGGKKEKKIKQRNRKAKNEGNTHTGLFILQYCKVTG